MITGQKIPYKNIEYIMLCLESGIKTFDGF